MKVAERMFLNCNPITQPGGTTREVRNMIATRLKETYFNEGGFDRVATDFPLDGKIVGGIEFPDDEVVVFVDRYVDSLLTGYSQVDPGTAGPSFTSELTGLGLTGVGAQTSDIVYKPISLPVGTTIRIKYTGVAVTPLVGAFSTVTVEGVFLDNANAIITTFNLSIDTSTNGVPTSGTGEGIIPTGAVSIGFRVIFTTITGQEAIFTDITVGGNDEIGIIDIDNIYTKILGTETLEYNLANPIKGVGVYDSFGNKIIAWTDEITDPRILNISELPFAVDVNKNIISEENLNVTLLFPQSISPVITADTLIAGSVLTGAYYIAVAYQDNQGTITEFHIPYGPIFINDEAESASNSDYDGAPAGSGSGKGIRATLSGLDTRYPKIVVAIIAKINGQFSVKGLTDIQIASTTNVIYTGNETTETLTLEEVLNKQPNYRTVRDMAVLGDTLYHANLTVDDEIDYQSQANAIIANYRTTLRPLSTKSIEIGSERTFFPGQVVAIYIRWILNNGKVSKAFHIPGRSVLSGDKDSSTYALAQGILNPDGSTPFKYQLEDTTNKNGQSYTGSVNDTLSVTDITKSNLGFWENMNETYPSDFPNYGGQKVRHHVFPTIEKCRSQHYSGIADYGRTSLNKLSLDISNVQMTSDLAAKAIGYEILIAEIDIDNANVLAFDQLIYAHRPAQNPGDFDFANYVWSGVGNWRVIARQAGETDGGAGDWTDFVIRRDYIRCHAFDLMKNKPAINPTHIKGELHWVKSNINWNYTDSGIAGGRITAAGKDIGRISAAVLDMSDLVSNVVSSISNVYRKITLARYLPTGIVVDEGGDRLIQLGCEPTLLLKVSNNSGTGFDVNDNNNRFRNFSPNAANGELMDPAIGNGQEESYLISINQLRTDVFNSFHTQILVSLSKGQLIPKSNTNKIGLEADCFMGYDSFVMAGAALDDNPNPLSNNIAMTEGLMTIRNFPTYARNNPNMRHINPAISGSKYYPKVDGNGWISNPNTNASEFISPPWDGNVIEYNQDYSSKSNLLQTEIYYPGLTDELANYPNRVIRSAKFSRTGKIVGAFRTYLEEEFYEANLNKGPINNLAVVDDVLLIHHKYGLFRTIGKEGLKLGTTEVYLGERGLFDIEPKEQIPAKLGYLGNQNKFGTLTFKGGYAFTDVGQGKMFLATTSSGIIEISKEGGLSNEFIEKLRGAVEDNPFNNNGVAFAYDEDNDRMIFTKVSNTNPFTLSYSFSKNGYISYHDYIPKFMVSTRNKIILQRDIGKIYKANSTTKKGIYFDDTIYPSKFTMVFNNPQKKDLTFACINWITHLINNVGVIDRNKTFTKIRLKTSYQDTGDIVLTPYQSLLVKGNIRKENNRWNFNRFRATAIAPRNARFVDSYIEVTLTYDNAKNLDNSQNTLYLYDLDFEAIIAER